MRKLFLIFILTIFLFGCQKDPFITDFPYMKNTDHIFEKVDYYKAYNFFENGTGAILLVYNSTQYSCPYCKVCIPIINNIGKDNNVETIFYLDIFEMRTNNTDEYHKLLTLIDNQVDDLIIRDDKTILAVPDLYFIVEGEIVKHHIATIYDEVNEKYLTVLNVDEEQLLKNIYQEGFTLLNQKR